MGATRADCARMPLLRDRVVDTVAPNSRRLTPS